MIARVARFTYPSQQHRDEAERNGSERVGPSLAREPGFQAIYYGRTAELEALSISVFEHREANEAAATVMNAQPLLPGQAAQMLPTPAAVAFYDVLSSMVHDRLPTIGRVGYLTVAPGRADAGEADTWGVDVFAPMLEGVAGICQAYLLRSPDSGERIALTMWDNPDAMRAGGEAIGSWQAREAAAGRSPALTGANAVSLTDLRVIVAGVEAPVTTPP
jgi:heme-degrading monooxygenase HmoA